MAQFLISRLTFAKLLELALTCICVGIHYHSYNTDPEVGMLVTGTFVGFLVVFAGSALGHLLGTPTGKRVDIFFSLIGAALFIASGALLIDRYHGQGSGSWTSKNLAKASMAIINGAVLIADAVFTQRGG